MAVNYPVTVLIVLRPPCFGCVPVGKLTCHYNFSMFWLTSQDCSHIVPIRVYAGFTRRSERVPSGVASGWEVNSTQVRTTLQKN